MVYSYSKIAVFSRIISKSCIKIRDIEAGLRSIITNQQVAPEAKKYPQKPWTSIAALLRFSILTVYTKT
jgi:hypothetical protein